MFFLGMRRKYLVLTKYEHSIYVYLIIFTRCVVLLWSVISNFKTSRFNINYHVVDF